MKKKTSLKDIAAALNVSSTLVSMVLNGQSKQHGISATTEQKVIQKAKELNYQPNTIARGLRTGKTNTIGLIVTDISNSFYAQIAKKIETIASEKGYHLIFCSSNEKVEKEEMLIRMLRSRQVDGLIIASTCSDNSILNELLDDQFPVVLIDRLIPGISTNHVVVDNYKSSFDAVEKLIESGHSNIGLLTIGPSHLSSIRDRESGYLDALHKHNLPIVKEYIHEISFKDVNSTVGHCLNKLLEHPNPVSAIFSTNNNIAKACLHHLNKLNIRIPEQIALLTYDDLDLFEFCHPSVTAIAQPIDAIGEQSLEILLDLINQKSEIPKKQVVLPANLVIRKSCGTTQTGKQTLESKLTNSKSTL